MAAQAPRPRHGELVYPGTCRDGLHGRPARAVRLRDLVRRARQRGWSIEWRDRRLGAQRQDVGRTSATSSCDVPMGCGPTSSPWWWTTRRRASPHVVRGEDLADNTPRQIHLQRALGLPTPQLPAHAAGARCRWREALEAERRRRTRPARCALGRTRAGCCARCCGLAVDADEPGAWLAEAVNPSLATSARGAGMMAAPALPLRRKFAMITTASGLQYEDTNVGQRRRSARPASTSPCTTPAGSTTTASRAPSSTAARTAATRSQFGLGAGMVIRGWDEGVQGMKVGGTRAAGDPAAARLRRARRGRRDPAERHADVRGRIARRLSSPRA